LAAPAEPLSPLAAAPPPFAELAPPSPAALAVPAEPLPPLAELPAAPPPTELPAAPPLAELAAPPTPGAPPEPGGGVLLDDPDCACPDPDTPVRATTGRSAGNQSGKSVSALRCTTIPNSASPTVRRSSAPIG
jgi:hypothetical protein